MQGVLHLCQQWARLTHSLQGALGFGLGFAAPFGSLTWKAAWASSSRDVHGGTRPSHALVMESFS